MQNRDMSTRGSLLAAFSAISLSLLAMGMITSASAFPLRQKSWAFVSWGANRPSPQQHQQLISASRSPTAGDEGKAVAAAKDAAATAKAVDHQTEVNLAIVPEGRGLFSGAAVSAKATKTTWVATKSALDWALWEGRVEAKAAAEEAVAEMKWEAWQQMAAAKAARAEKERKIEDAAFQAGTRAAEPYHEAMARAQELTVEYTRKAQELVAAGNNLKQQAQNLAGSAEHYQFTGNVVQAQQIMMQAHMLFNQAETMHGRAKSLYSAANGMNSAIPAYQLAAYAAQDAAAWAANPPSAVPDPLASPY